MLGPEFQTSLSAGQRPVDYVLTATALAEPPRSAVPFWGGLLQQTGRLPFSRTLLAAADKQAGGTVPWASTSAAPVHPGAQALMVTPQRAVEISSLLLLLLLLVVEVGVCTATLYSVRAQVR